MRGFLPIRGQDKQGSGHYGAKRGDRTHQGIDFACQPGTGIYPMKAGKVTKLGKPYDDNPKTPINEYKAYDYVQITDEAGFDYRYFYVFPVVRVGDMVTEDTVIGVVQELHYDGIVNHCHFEVQKNGKYLDPRDFLVVK